MEPDYVRGHLATMVLAVLADGPAHGYGIAVELRRASGERLEILEGSLYPALHRLEAAGLVAGEWETAEGRRRRAYSITADGKSELAEHRRSWRWFRSLMNELLGVPDAR